MTQAKTSNLYTTTYHCDGTVTVWDVYEQRWTRMAAGRVGDRILASLNDSERKRIAKMASKYTYPLC